MLKFRGIIEEIYIPGNEIISELKFSDSLNQYVDFLM